MSKQFKLLMILVNGLLSLLYIISSYFFWQELNNWYDYNMQSTWTPFYVYPHRIPNMPTVLMPVPRMVNLPFIIFCIILAINCILLVIYFVIPRLLRWATDWDGYIIPQNFGGVSTFKALSSMCYAKPCWLGCRELWH